MHTVINELSRTCFIFSINNSSSWSATFLPSKLPYALCPKGKIHTCPNTAQDSKASSPSPPTQVHFLLTHQTPEDLTVFSSHSRKYNPTYPGWQMFRLQAQSWLLDSHWWSVGCSKVYSAKSITTIICILVLHSLSPLWQTLEWLLT